MRDEGLARAIEAAGGISALARRLGLAQPSISNWTRVPAERVLAVESLTDVSRHVLRPDLYPENAPELDPIEAARSRAYLLLAGLLIRVPDTQLMLELCGLDGDETAFGEALSGLAAAARATHPDQAAREHFDLFIGVGRGELLPFGSYYLTGFLYERPLVRIRQDFRILGLEREAGVSEPEDHLGVLCEVMAGLAARRFVAEPGFERRFFQRHLEPWAEKFFGDLERAEAARFYRAVGRFGRVFISMEREAFALEQEQAGAASLPVREGSDA